MKTNKIFDKQLEHLAGSRVLITGATGLIGQTLMRILLAFNENAHDPIHIIALVRNLEKAYQLFGSSAKIEYIIGDVRSADFSGICTDYIIHAASETSSRAFVQSPVDTIGIAFDGTRHLLEYAKTQELKKFIYTSTMEVYGAPETEEKITEKQGTNLDTMKVRSCYPESKRLCECMCASYWAQYQVPAIVLRLTQSFGPGVLYNDGRVFAEFARCAIEGRNIVLKTKGETKRNYLHVEDAASAIICAMLKGEAGESYNVANEETYCSIFEMANLVANRFGNGKTQVIIEEQDTSKFGYAPTLKMNLDTSKLRKLGWVPDYTLEDMFRDLIEDMKKTKRG